jgi:hypothetical protein
MTLDDVIRMAREAGYGWSMTNMHAPSLARFAALVAEAEADKYNTGVHTCSNHCQRHLCVRVREAVAAEREACAKFVEDWSYPKECAGCDQPTPQQYAQAIRARGIP